MMRLITSKTIISCIVTVALQPPPTIASAIESQKRAAATQPHEFTFVPPAPVDMFERQLKQKFRIACYQYGRIRGDLRFIKNLNQEIQEEEQDIEPSHNMLHQMTEGTSAAAQASILKIIDKKVRKRLAYVDLKAQKQRAKRTKKELHKATSSSEIESIISTLKQQQSELTYLKEILATHRAKQEHYLNTLIHHISLINRALPKNSPLRIKTCEDETPTT